MEQRDKKTIYLLNTDALKYEKWCADHRLSFSGALKLFFEEAIRRDALNKQPSKTADQLIQDALKENVDD